MERGEEKVIEVVGMEGDSLQGSDWIQRLGSSHQNHHPHNSHRPHRRHNHNSNPSSSQFQEVQGEFFENNRPAIPHRSHHQRSHHQSNHYPSRRPIVIDEFPPFREAEEGEEEDINDFGMKKVVQSAVPSSFIHYRYYKNGGSSSSPRVWSPNASASSSTTSTSLGTTTIACEAVGQPGHYNVKGTCHT